MFAKFGLGLLIKHFFITYWLRLIQNLSAMNFCLLYFSRLAFNTCHFTLVFR